MYTKCVVVIERRKFQSFIFSMSSLEAIAALDWLADVALRDFISILGPDIMSNFLKATDTKRQRTLEKFPSPGLGEGITSNRADASSVSLDVSLH